MISPIFNNGERWRAKNLETLYYPLPKVEALKWFYFFTNNKDTEFIQ